MMASENEAQQIVECDLCQQPVSFFCRRCRMNLCDPCVLKHLRIKSKNGHDIVDFLSKDDDNTCLCDSHPQLDCSAHCKTCDVPICILCVSIKHKSHEISELSDKIEELLKVIARENDRLQSQKQELERILEHTTKMLSSITSFYKQRKDEVTAQGEESHKQLEAIVKKLHQRLDDRQKEHENALQTQKKEFEDIIRKVDEINGEAIKYHKSKNVTEMQKFIPVIEEQETLREFSQYLFPTIFKCEPDEDYWDSIVYADKLHEQKISLMGNKFEEIDYSGKTILEIPTIVSVTDTGFPAADDEHRLNDMAVTDDNQVWMGGEGEELKLFDIQGHLHHTVSITDTGIYFSMYNKHVVYTCIDQNDSAVKMVSDADTVDTMFTTGEWGPYGVTSTASGDLLVCLCRDNQSKVVRYSSTGTVLQEIQYDSHCQSLYKDATNITENINGDIIVTDSEKNAVITVDRLGVFRYSYSGQDSDFEVSSVATDSVGYVIVTDIGGDKIHMLDRDGRFLRYIIPDEGIKNPGGVCILAHGEMMVGECLTGIAKRIKYLEE